MGLGSSVHLEMVAEETGGFMTFEQLMEKVVKNWDRQVHDRITHSIQNLSDEDMLRLFLVLGAFLGHALGYYPVEAWKRALSVLAGEE